MPAYRVDPAVKQALLRALDAGDPLPIYARSISYAERVAWAEDVGIPAAIVLLAAHLLERYTDDAVADARALLHAIQPGADLSRVAFAIASWTWMGGPEPLRDASPDADYVMSGDAVSQLQDRAARGETVAPREWRAARTALEHLAERGGAAAAARVLAAGAWDLCTVHGALVDLFRAWDELQLACINSEHGWTKEDADLLQAGLNQAREAAAGRLGPPPEDPAGPAYRRQLVTEALAIIEASGNACYRRHRELQVHVRAAMTGARKTQISAMIFLLQDAGTAR